jgi:MFS family permease
MSAHGNPLRTLARHRDLRWLFVAGVVSDIGTWMQAVTVGTLVAETSRSAGATALVMSVMFLPQGLCSPFGGVLADRFDRRRMAMALLGVQAVLAVGLALLVRAGLTSAVALAGVILVQGCANALANPALQALTPQLVPPEDLLPALSLGSISWNSGRIIGPTLGALCATAWGPSTTIMANAVSFLVPVLALAGIRRRFHGGGHVDLARVFGELRTAAGIARRTPSIRILLPAIVIVQLMLSTLLPAIPFYGRQVLGGGSGTVTALFVALGGGAMLAAAFVPALTLHLGRSVVMRIFVGCLSVGMLLAAAARSPEFAVLAVAVHGAGITGFFVASGTIVQRDALETHRGRLVSIYAAATGMSYGIGAPLNGWIADHTWGLRTHLVVWAVLLAVAAAVVQTRRPEWYAVLDGDDPAPRRTRRGVMVEA